MKKCLRGSRSGIREVMNRLDAEGSKAEGESRTFVGASGLISGEVISGERILGGIRVREVRETCGA